MIKIKDLTKNYGEKTGNFEINLNIKDGECFGILGPNGAGKTTLIRQIMGFIKSDKGSILINDLNPWKDSKKIMEDVGYVAGEISLYDNLTGTQYLNLIKLFRENISNEYVENLKKHFDIKTNRKIKKMSKGMKQKIAIISAVMSKPKLLILDEPTSGLDPVMKIQFNKLILKLKEQGVTIIICSHIFKEITDICDKVGFIKEGKLIKEIEITKNTAKEVENIFKKIYERKDFI